MLSGVTLSIITPNQIGDFVGRVLHLQVLNKLKGSFVAVVGHTAQILVTAMFGVVALWFFGEQLNLLYWWVPASILIVFLIYQYLKLGSLYQKIEAWKWIQRVQKYLHVFGDFSANELREILVLSFFRYLIYLVQYILLLHFFKVDISIPVALFCVMGTFSRQSMVPSFLLLEVGLRGASALLFFTIFTSNVTGVLLTAYSLWMLNLLLPGIIGLYVIYRIKT